jgi:hypothetical protein
MQKLFKQLGHRLRESDHDLFLGVLYVFLWLMILVVTQASWAFQHDGPFCEAILWTALFWVLSTVVILILRGGILRDAILGGALLHQRHENDGAKEKEVSLPEGAERFLIGYLLLGIVLSEVYYFVPGFAGITILILLAALAIYFARTLTNAEPLTFKGLIRCQVWIIVLGLIATFGHWAYVKNPVAREGGDMIAPYLTDTGKVNSALRKISLRSEAPRMIYISSPATVPAARIETAPRSEPKRSSAVTEPTAMEATAEEAPKVGAAVISTSISTKETEDNTWAEIGDITPGQVIKSWGCVTWDVTRLCTGPDGAGNVAALDCASDFPDPSGKTGALIGKIDDGPIFTIGRQHKISQGGKLYARVNYRHPESLPVFGNAFEVRVF